MIEAFLGREGGWGRFVELEGRKGLVEGFMGEGMGFGRGLWSNGVGGVVKCLAILA